VHERQRHELGEAAGLALQPGQQLQVRDPVLGASTCPYIIVLVVGMPSRCAVVTTSTHCELGSLPLVRHPADLVVQDLGGRARQAVHPRLGAATRKSAIGTDMRAAPLTTSIGLKACRCSPGAALFTARARSR
jgi:hypothetical protein